MPSCKTFRSVIIPDVLAKLKKKIEIKCQNAETIVLIPDGWTASYSNVEFLGNNLLY